MGRNSTYRIKKKRRRCSSPALFRIWIKRIPSAPRSVYSDRGSFFELRAASMTQSAMTASQAAQNSHTLL